MKEAQALKSLKHYKMYGGASTFPNSSLDVVDYLNM